MRGYEALAQNCRLLAADIHHGGFLAARAFASVDNEVDFSSQLLSNFIGS
jgi:hypothetical protein